MDVKALLIEHLLKVLEGKITLNYLKSYVLEFQNPFSPEKKVIDRIISLNEGDEEKIKEGITDCLQDLMKI
jgi:hypothetical protein